MLYILKNHTTIDIFTKYREKTHAAVPNKPLGEYCSNLLASFNR